MAEKDEDRQYKIRISCRNQIKDIHENQMTDEQFKDFAIGWISESALADYINDLIESEENIDLLEEWLDYTKRCLNTKPDIESETIESAIEEFTKKISHIWKDEPLDGDETESIAFHVLDNLDRCNGNIADSKGDREPCYMVGTWSKVTDDSVAFYNKEDGEKEVAQLREMQPENIYMLVQVY